MGKRQLHVKKWGFVLFLIGLIPLIIFFKDFGYWNQVFPITTLQGLIFILVIILVTGFALMIKGIKISARNVVK